MVVTLRERSRAGATSTVTQEGMEITPKELFGFGTRHCGDGDGWWVGREQGRSTWHGMTLTLKDPT